MKIKIFVDAHVFDDTYQGTTTYIKGLYNALVKNDQFEITLAANDIEKLKVHFTDRRFKFISLPSNSKIRRLAIDIPRLIKKGNFDYAHFQYITPLIKECKYINTIHDILFLEFPKLFPLKYRIKNKLTFKFSALQSDIICTVSAFSKDALVKYMNIDKSKIIITPNAIDEEKVDFVDVKRKYDISQFILFVSRFEPRKNHYLLLKVFVETKLYLSYKLVLIGKRRDVETADFNNYFDGLPETIKKSIIFFEGISVEELSSFYKEADLFIYPSAAEGFGIPPLEAAVAGCKVLCSNKTAMSDFDFFGKYLFDPENIEEFKSKINQILNDENYPFAEISTAAHNKYNWQVISNKFGGEIINNYLVNSKY